MASPTKNSSLFLILITLLSSLNTQAKDIDIDTQLFNKVPNVNPIDKQHPNEQRQENNPNFVPLDENPYGLYGHRPHSAATTTTTAATPYDSVSYTTHPQDTSDSNEKNSFTTNPSNNYYNGAQNYYKSYPTTANNRKHNNYYYNGGGALHSRENYFNSGGEASGFRQQGMSDTRFMENGKYFYDVNAEKYSNNHPYEILRKVRERNGFNNMKSYYGNGENAYEFNGENSMGRFQNQDEFQNEENNMP